jgi:sulfatase modifying factor 1
MFRAIVWLLALTLVSALHRSACADSIGSGVNSFSIDFVTIGNPGNPADTTGNPNPAGSVPYSYRIGKYEISEQMIEKANLLGGLGITKDARGSDKPATSVSWFEAAQFANWLNTSTGHTPAYKFDAGGAFQLWLPSDPGYNAGNLFRNGLAKYFLPSADEWYKAAYYDPVAGVYWDYPTGSNALPIPTAGGTAPGTAVVLQDLAAGPADIMQAGGMSASGTTGQGGNVSEWEETEFDLSNNSVGSLRGGRGGGWNSVRSDLSSQFSRAGRFPELSLSGNGFRIASLIPEPAAEYALSSAIFLLLLSKGFRPVRAVDCLGVIQRQRALSRNSSIYNPKSRRDFDA